MEKNRRKENLLKKTCKFCKKNFTKRNPGIEFTSQACDALWKIFQIQMKNFPESQVCQKCHGKLLDFYEFYELVRQCQENLEEKQLESDTFHDNDDLQLEELSEDKLQMEIKIEPKNEEDSVNPSNEQTFESIECKSESINEESEINSKKIIQQDTAATQKCSKMWICEACGKIYKSQASFMYHVSTHKRTKKNCNSKSTNSDTGYTCDICGTMIVTYHAMKRHILRLHLKTLTYVCDICGRNLSSQYHLQRHKALHNNETKREKCPDCGLFFFQLKNHRLLNHSFHGLLKCDKCDKEFTNKYKLNMHEYKFHSDPDKYACKVCGARYKNGQALKEHNHQKHIGDFLYFCKWCDYKGNYKKNYKAHISKLHPEVAVARRNEYNDQFENADGKKISGLEAMCPNLQENVVACKILK